MRGITVSKVKKMWKYLKSIGFEDRSDDEQLRSQLIASGYQCVLACDHVIARDSLCAYYDHDDSIFGFIDTTKAYGNYGCSIKDLNIHSVSDLEAWLRKEYPEFFNIEQPTTKQHQYKVGDKVRILEDATDSDGFCVLENFEGIKTAVGEIGVVNSFPNNSCICVDLPEECGSWWTYKHHQVELVTDKPLIEETTLEQPSAVPKIDASNKDVLIKEVISNFEWEKVHDVMTYLNWEWFSVNGVPSIGYMICTVQDTLSRVFDRLVTEDSPWQSSSSGGFTAEAFLQDGVAHLKLCFNVAEYDTAL